MTKDKTQTKFCILLSGCGVFDGSEIHEAVATLIACSKAGIHYTISAPNIDQHHVINHHTGQEMPETRNVLVESARIARGAVVPAEQIQVEDFDALFIPGGFGAAKNLSTFAFAGDKASMEPHVQRLIQEFHQAKKPIGAVCIAPALLALALRTGNITIGSDTDTANTLQQLGASHIVCPVTEAITDSTNKLVTAPAYMENAPIHEIAEGIEKAVYAVLALCN